MNKPRKEKKQKDQNAEKELLVAIASLGEIVTVEEPEDWLEEGEEK